MVKLESIKAVTRPVLTLMVAATGCAIAMYSTYVNNVIPTWFIASFANIITFWFVTRSLNGKDKNR